MRRGVEGVLDLRSVYHCVGEALISWRGIELGRR